MTKVHRAHSKTIDENRIRYDLYLNIVIDQGLIRYLAPFLEHRRANDELRRLLNIGLQASTGHLALTPAVSPAGIPDNHAKALSITRSIAPKQLTSDQEDGGSLTTIFGMPADD